MSDGETQGPPAITTGGPSLSESPGITTSMDLTVEWLAAIRAISTPGMTPSGDAYRFLGSRGPCGRARIPTALGVLEVDERSCAQRARTVGKILAWLRPTGHL